MSATFITARIWPELTKAVRNCRQRCMAAVAYSGANARRLLPMPKGSCLVVDSSERAVASGQTCPKDLLALMKRGVAIYSVPNLHAKVFVIGRTAYIGSTNVSVRSASQLIEAAVRTTEPKVVSAARDFVRKHCLHELTPTILKRLAKLYRPPRIPGGKRGNHRKLDSSVRPTLPRLLLAQLRLVDWSKRDQALHDEALAVAKKRRQHPRSFELDSFRWTGKCYYQRGDIVIEVTDKGGGSAWVSPPGNVLHVRSQRYGKRQVSFVYLELPARKRRHVSSLARALGRGAKKRLSRDGVVRNASFRERLLNVWSSKV